MQCPKCGVTAPEGSTFCADCGARLPQHAPAPDHEPMHQTEEATPRPSGASDPKTLAGGGGGLGWYKFLIYFALWLSAVFSLWNGIKMLTGLVYGSDAALVYSYLPTLKIVDMTYGVLILLCAALAIYARFMLARYRRSGPPCLYALYIATNAADLLYVAATSLLLGESTLNSQTSSSCVTSIIFLVINITYFQKRKHLFIN